MKNFLIAIIVLSFSLAGFSSCKKKYKCSCTSVNSTDGSTYTVENAYMKKLSKSKASEQKEKCEATPDCQFLRDKK